MRKEIIAVSKAYGVMSRETSFVAVEMRSDTDRTLDEAVLRKVPVMAITAGMVWTAGFTPPLLQRASASGRLQSGILAHPMNRLCLIRWHSPLARTGNNRHGL